MLGPFCKKRSLWEALTMGYNKKQIEVLKKIRKLPLRKFGSAKHKKLIKEFVLNDTRFQTPKIL